MESTEIVKAVPIPDKKSTDKFGNPLRWILRIAEPRELRGLIAFPRGFEVVPGKEYVVEIIRREKNYAVVRLHEHRWVEARREEDPYIIKIVFRCSCGAWKVEHVKKHHMPLVDGWKLRWYVQYAVELRRRSEEVRKNAPPRRYYYIAVRREHDTVERLFHAVKQSEEICREHETVIYDDENGKWRTVEAWRGAKDKSWLCTEYPPFGYIAVLGWVDKESFVGYKKAKEESERLWNQAEEILGERIDIGQCIPESRGACRRYASRLASFL